MSYLRLLDTAIALLCIMSYFSRTESRLRPYPFIYPERSLTMEEMLNKFIDKGKQEYEEMTSEPVVQPTNETPTPPVPFPRRLRKEKEEAQQKKFLENLKQLYINLPFIDVRNTKFLGKCRSLP
ncbi:hypothetical protein Tco_1160458 [Tanacetum coccineum]